MAQAPLSAPASICRATKQVGIKVCIRLVNSRGSKGQSAEHTKHLSDEKQTIQLGLCTLALLVQPLKLSRLRLRRICSKERPKSKASRGPGRSCCVFVFFDCFLMFLLNFFQNISFLCEKQRCCHVCCFCQFSLILAHSRSFLACLF